MPFATLLPISAWQHLIEYMPNGRIGKVQLRTRRALIAAWPNPVRVTDLLSWSYPRIARPNSWHRVAVHRAVRRWAVVVGKAGRANLWALRPEMERHIQGVRLTDSDS
jgi:hypothetical protein